MVIDNIHDNPDSRLMECLHQSLELLYPHISAIRISGVATFRGVVVLRVITPVEKAVLRLIDCCIVENRQQLHMANPKRDKIINPNGKA